jgi:hypothetical protein
VNNRQQTLFCPGIPGAGKTMLTSIVVDNLQHRFHGEATVGLAYIYFNYRRRDEQKMGDILASILKQLCQSLAWVPEEVKKLYDQHQKYRTRPSSHNILSLLHTVCGLYSGVFVIFDALDECHDIDGSRERFLSELFNLQANCAVNIFATSRFVPVITCKFDPSTALEIQAPKEDVERYVEGRIEGLPNFVQRNSQLREDIRRGISEAVDGMYVHG